MIHRLRNTWTWWLSQGKVRLHPTEKYGRRGYPNWRLIFPSASDKRIRCAIAGKTEAGFHQLKVLLVQGLGSNPQGKKAEEHMVQLPVVLEALFLFSVQRILQMTNSLKNFYLLGNRWNPSSIGTELEKRVWKLAIKVESCQDAKEIPHNGSLYWLQQWVRKIQDRRKVQTGF